MTDAQRLAEVRRCLNACCSPLITDNQWLLAQLDAMLDVLRDISTNYDCDMRPASLSGDARHAAHCRACIATAQLERLMPGDHT